MDDIDIVAGQSIEDRDTRTQDRRRLRIRKSLRRRGVCVLTTDRKILALEESAWLRSLGHASYVRGLYRPGHPRQRWSVWVVKAPQYVDITGREVSL